MSGSVGLRFALDYLGRIQALALVELIPDDPRQSEWPTTLGVGRIHNK